MRRKMSPWGYATVLVLIVVSVMLTLVFSAAGSASQVMSMSTGDTGTEIARMAAEGGVADALTQLKADRAWNAGFTKKPMPTMTGNYYTVLATNNLAGTASAQAPDGTSVPAGSCYLQSTGSAGQYTRTVAVMARNGSTSPWKWALYGTQTGIEVQNGTTIDSYNSSQGDYSARNQGSEALVGSNGAIIVDAGAKLLGTGSSVSTVTVQNGGQLGASSQLSSPTTFPVPDTTYKTPNANTTGISGNGYNYNASTRDLTVSAGGTVTLAAGTYYFKNVVVAGTGSGRGGGNLYVGSGPVIIYMTGNLSVNNGGALNNNTKVPANLRIYSSSTSSNAVYLGGGGSVYAAIYAPAGGLVLDNGTNLYGSAIAGSVELENGADVHQDLALGNLDSDLGGTSTVLVTSWERR